MDLLPPLVLVDRPVVVIQGAIRISYLKIYTIPTNYNETNTTTALNSFTQTNSGVLQGTIGTLLGVNGNGGLAWLISGNTCDIRRNYCSMNYDYSIFPNYSWNVNVIAHEAGHNLGSNHTQWCGWTGGALDNCYQTEGGCASGPAPINGGTIMSYCHLTGSGINFNNGFGVQPRTVITNTVNNSTCFTSSDTGNDRIQRLSLTGDHQATWGTTGALTGQFSSPGGLDVSGGEVYFADRGNQRIQVFNPDGDFLREWPTAAAPEGVAVDQDGNVVVAEGSRLETFTATGTPLATHVLDTTARAVGVEIDGGGNTWVADGERDQLLKLRPDGTVVEHVALTAGMPFGTRRTPQDLAFSADRRIFVVTGERLMEYQGPTGALLDVSLTVLLAIS